MARGQVTKYLHDDDDGFYIVIHPSEGMMVVNDKLYTSEKIARNNSFGSPIKITKALLSQLYNEQHTRGN